MVLWSRFAILTLSFLAILRSEDVLASFVEEITPDSTYAKEEKVNYPVWAQFMMTNFLKYKPDVTGKPMSDDCELEHWTAKMESRHDFAGVSKGVSDYLKKCEKEIETGRNDVFRNTFDTMMLKLSPKEYSNAKFIILHLSDGQKLKGWLALKGDNRKRPLVILRLGIFSTVTQFLPERFLFMQLFEQSPFNVLVLESNSGHEYIFRNKKIVLGGYDEGRANLEIAEKLQSSAEPLSKIISDVHLAGMSMGGHGVMYASLLNSELMDKHKPALIKSAIAYCPLINFRDTFDYHLAQGVISKGIDYWVSRRLKGIEEVIPDLDIEHFIEGFTPYVNKHYPGPFWENNNFWSRYQNVKTPVMIFATEKDQIVPLAVNSERILNKYIDVKDSNLKIFKLPEGYHCSLPGAYDWKAMATLMNTSILQLSDYHLEKMSRKISLRREELVSSFVGTHNMKPKFIFEISKGEKPGALLLVANSEVFKKPIEISVAADEFGWAISDFEKSKDLLERWANQNIHVILLDQTDGSVGLQMEWGR